MADQRASDLLLARQSLEALGAENEKLKAACRKQIEQNILLQKSHEDEVAGNGVLLAEAKQNLKVLGDRLTQIEKKLSVKDAVINEKNYALAKAVAQINVLQGGHSAAASDAEACIVSLNKAHAEEVAALFRRISSLESELAAENTAPPSTVEADLRNEVERLRRENEELRARNEKIVDEVAETAKRIVAIHRGLPVPSSAKKAESSDK